MGYLCGVVGVCLSRFLIIRLIVCVWCVGADCVCGMMMRGEFHCPGKGGV